MKVLSVRVVTFLWLLLHQPLGSCLEVGDRVPACNLVNMTDGSTIDLERPGKVLLIDFWASWCGSCVQSFAYFQEIRKQYQDQGFEIIAVNLDEEPEEAKAFLASHSVDFILASNPDGQCPQRFHVKAMPTSFMVDRSGRIKHVEIGFNESIKETLGKNLQQAIVN